jgi:hypothetical protein
MSITKKRGSIALARSLCYQINGAADDSDDMEGSGYGSVDIAEILSAEVVRLQEALAQPHEMTLKEFNQQIHDDPNYHIWVKEREDRLKPELDALQVLANENQRMAKVIAELDAQRTWVGLTDKQTTQVIKSMPKGIKGWMIDWDLHDFSKAIEAKLKQLNDYAEEKNN